jgi:alpha-tubulin suppressor-like RCC1 family protein
MRTGQRHCRCKEWAQRQASRPLAITRVRGTLSDLHGVGEPTTTGNWGTAGARRATSPYKSCFPFLLCRCQRVRTTPVPYLQEVWRGAGEDEGRGSWEMGWGHTRRNRSLCWGRNESGMFGEASLASQEELPVALPPLADIEKLDIGIGHGCVVKSNGTMWCWGRGTAGQLGNGQNVDSPALVQVANLLGSNAISAGHNTSCASTLAGEAWCWGSNNAGQLGDGSTQSKNTPSQVLGGDEGFVGIDAGQYYTTCAWKDDGTAWCWGNNLHGQLGNGTTESSSVPVQVAGLTGVVEVSVGREYHACARTAEGAVWCWGGNFSGQLGDGSMLQRPTPVQVSGLGNATSVAVGWNHSCAATEQGDVWCWGRNTDGQLGDGTTANKWSPSKVLGLDGVAGVAAGADHTCAWTSEGKAWCWGRNTYGQLGDGSAWAEEPVQVIGFPF